MMSISESLSTSIVSVLNNPWVLVTNGFLIQVALVVEGFMYTSIEFAAVLTDIMSR